MGKFFITQLLYGFSRNVSKHMEKFTKLLILNFFLLIRFTLTFHSTQTRIVNMHAKLFCLNLLIF